MKKIYLLMTIAIITIIFCSCGNNGSENNNNMSVQESSASESETKTVKDELTCDALIKEVSKVIGDNYYPDMQIDADYLEQQTGITSDLYDDFAGEIPMITNNVDSIIIVKAKEGKIAEVEKKISDYRDRLVNDTLQYPVNIGKIQASRIEQIDPYVCFVQLGGDTTAVDEQGDEAVIAYCQEENELAISTIEAKVANGIQ